MTTTIWLPLDDSKEFFTAKTDSGYVGCYRSPEAIVITTDVFEKPLPAANAARKMKKMIETKTKTRTVKKVTQTKTVAVKKTQKHVKLQTKLFTAAQAETMPLLKFREVWVITHKDEFVSDCMNTQKKRLVAFTKDKDKAKRFYDHEDAKRSMNTLKGVVGPGFGLIRFFEKNT